jgi:putative iron-dependent peroxidase
LAPVPAAAAFLRLDVHHGADPRAAAESLADRAHPDHLVVGLGPSLLASLGARPEGLRGMPDLVAPGISVPSTPSDVWLRVAGADPGEVLHRLRQLSLLDFFEVDRVDGFMHGESRDLTGYIDGTENPVDGAAVAAAIAPDGSSVVAVQRWMHDLYAFDAMSRKEQNHTFGRDRASNEELDGAPPSAHVKRAAQEDFEPEAFMVRRSMPWSDPRGHGLVFVAFGATLDPFEAVLRRMMGHDDGVMDALFTFTKPVDGATYWCPPVEDGHLVIP